MFSFFKKHRIVLSSFLVATFLFACLGACARSNIEKPGGQQSKDGDKRGHDTKLAKANLGCENLTVSELSEFRPGRAKDDILKAVQWRGNLYMAAEHKGQAVCAIVYELLPDDSKIKAGVWIWAIFVDGKFSRFVKQPPTLPSDSEVVGHSKSGVPISRFKRLEVGDCRYLMRGVDGKAVSVADLKKEAKSLKPMPPRKIDLGLTAAYLLMRVTSMMPAPDAPASKKDRLKNTALRNQFNAARLNIGMTPSEVNAVFKAKPLESGKVKAGSYEINGSNESFNIPSWDHFQNVLIVFRKGKAITISSIPAGNDWRRKLGEVTVDLPTPARAEGGSWTGGITD